MNMQKFKWLHLSDLHLGMCEGFDINLILNQLKKVLMKETEDKHTQKGAIIVEATISLPIFMITIITLLSVVNICVAQSKMGTFINE